MFKLFYRIDSRSSFFVWKCRNSFFWDEIIIKDGRWENKLFLLETTKKRNEMQTKAERSGVNPIKSNFALKNTKIHVHCFTVLCNNLDHNNTVICLAYIDVPQHWSFPSLNFFYKIDYWSLKGEREQCHRKSDWYSTAKTKMFQSAILC